MPSIRIFDKSNVIDNGILYDGEISSSSLYHPLKPGAVIVTGKIGRAHV